MFSNMFSSSQNNNDGSIPADHALVPSRTFLGGSSSYDDSKP